MNFNSVIVFLKSVWNKAKVFLFGGGVVILVGFLSDGIAVLSPLMQKIDEWRGVDNLDLVVLNARLAPVYPSAIIEKQRDQVFLQVEIRNYGGSPIMLTSADVSVLNSKFAKVGVGGSISRCSLGSDPNKNTPLEIKSGSSVWLTLAEAVQLPGLSKWLTKDELSRVYVATPDDPYTIAETTYVENVNKEFSRLFGRDASIQVVLYSGIHIKQRAFQFKLSEGGDVFASDGGLQHDWFVANWKHWSPRAIFANSGCK